MQKKMQKKKKKRKYRIVDNLNDPSELNAKITKTQGPKKNTFMSNITNIKNTILESADVAIGKLIALKGVHDNTELFEKRKEIETSLYNHITNNNIEYNKEGIQVYIEENPPLLELIQQLIYINELLKGREITKVNEITGKQEDELPTNINSYILIVASIMIEDNADLTYGLANVSNEELDDYFKAHAHKNKKKKAYSTETGGKKSKRKHRKNNIKYTRKNHAKYTRKNKKYKKYKTKKNKKYKLKNK